MCWFLLTVAKSQSYAVSKAGIKKFLANKGDSFEINLENGKLDTVVYWWTNQYHQEDVHVFNSSGYVYNFSLSEFDNSFRVSGSKVSFTVNSNVGLSIWTFLHDVCKGPSFLYSTNYFLSDIFTLTKDLNGESLCFFYDNEISERSFYYQLDSPNHDNFITKLHFSDDLDHPDIQTCNGKCDIDISKEFFLEAIGLVSNTVYQTSYQYQFLSPNNVICSKRPIPWYKEELVSDHDPSQKFNHNLIKVVQDVNTRGEVLTCDKGGFQSDLFHLILIPSIFFFVIIIFSILFKSGLCFQLQNRIQGDELPNTMNNIDDDIDVEIHIEEMDSDSVHIEEEN